MLIGPPASKYRALVFRACVSSRVYAVHVVRVLASLSNRTNKREPLRQAKLAAR